MLKSSLKRNACFAILVFYRGDNLRVHHGRVPWGVEEDAHAPCDIPGGGVRHDVLTLHTHAVQCKCHHPRISLQWRHNGRDGVSNHQGLDCLLNHLFRWRSQKTSKLRVTGLCAGNSPVTGDFPTGHVTRKCFHVMTSSCLHWLPPRVNSDWAWVVGREITRHTTVSKRQHM